MLGTGAGTPGNPRVCVACRPDERRGGSALPDTCPSHALLWRSALQCGQHYLSFLPVAQRQP